MSSSPVTVTVRAVFQVLPSNVNAPGAAAPSVPSRAIATATDADGRVDNRTVNESALPSSAVASAVLLSTRPGSLSALVTLTVRFGTLASSL